MSSLEETVPLQPEAQITRPQREILKKGDIRKAHVDRGIAVDEETGSPIVASFELPNSEGPDLAKQKPERVVKVAYSNNLGYVVCAPGTTVKTGEYDAEEQTVTFDEVPLTIGRTAGSKIIIGRAGFHFEYPGKEPYDLPLQERGYYSRLGNLLADPTVSRQHLRLDVLPDMSLQITDLSANGVAVETPSI